MMNHLARWALLFFIPAGLGCVGPRAVAAPSTPSTSFSASSAYSAPSYNPVRVTTLTTAPGEVVVRAEEVMQSFTFRTHEVLADRQLEALQAAVKELEARLGSATGGAAKVTVVGVRMEGTGSGKAKTGGVVSLLDGEVVLALPPEATVWDRAKLLLGLQRTAAVAAEEGLWAEAMQVEASFGVPTPRVVDVERYRPQLTERWASRVKAFIQAAQAPHAPLAVVGCQPPPQVTQRPLSIERVALSLEPSCRVDVAKAP